MLLLPPQEGKKTDNPVPDGVYQGETVYIPGDTDAEPGDTLTLAAQVVSPTTTGEHYWSMVVSFPACKPGTGTATAT